MSFIYRAQLPLLFSTLFLFYYPYIGFLVLCIVATITTLFDRYSKVYPVILYFLVILLLLIMGTFIATKTSLQIIGNDKFQYIGYLQMFRQGLFIDIVSLQPEIVSFGILNILQNFVGINNWTFYLYFVISLLPLVYGIAKLDSKVLPIFILTYVACSAFYTLYGNIIRQGLAAGFLVFAFSNAGYKKHSAVSLMLFSHMSFILFLPLLYMPSTISNTSNRKILLTALFCFIASFACSLAFESIFSLLSNVGIHSVSSKVELYLGWGEYDVREVIKSTSIIVFFTCTLIHIDSKGYLFNDESKRLRKQLSIAVCYILSISIFTSSNPVIFNRFYSVLLIFFIWYFWECIYSLKISHVKTLLVVTSALLLVIINYLLIGSHDWYYQGAPLSIFDDNFYEMFKRVSIL